MLFRRSDSAFQLFEEDYRMEAFFLLLDWSLKHQPEKILIETSQKVDTKKEKVIDTAYLAFRVSEILDSGVTRSVISKQSNNLWIGIVFIV